MTINLFGEDVPEQETTDNDFWCTPLDLYPEDCFDPCPRNPTFDGLSIPWHGKVFCNPPYSQIPLWIGKALKEAQSSDVQSIDMLLPSWTDRAWFQLIKDYPIDFKRGRLKFLDPATMQVGKYNPQFGSMIVKIK